MPMFRAIKKGYYGDVIHDPDTGHHVVFEAREGFSCSWAVPVDGEAPVAEAPEVSEDTEAAEAILDAESDAAREDIPAVVEDEGGVETL